MDREPDGRTQFPIHTKPREFNERMVADLHPDHADAIRRMQPNGAAWLSQFGEFALRVSDAAGLAAGHPLALLADLTNIDKHRALGTSLVGVATAEVGQYEEHDCEITYIDFTPNMTLRNGAEWVSLEVVPTGLDPRVDVHDRFTTSVSFAGWDIEREFEQIAGLVASIIQTFEPVF